MTVLQVIVLYPILRIRNMISATQKPLKELSNIAIQFTISLDLTMKQSQLLAFFANRRNFKFADVHVAASQRIAEAVVKYDVSRFIHVSSYNADPNSQSKFFRSKVSIFVIFLTS